MKRSMKAYIEEYDRKFSNSNTTAGSFYQARR